MPINNKDGSPFQLSGPNPLLKEQESWDTDEQILLHNLQPEEVVATDAARDLRIPTPYDVIDTAPRPPKADEVIEKPVVSTKPAPTQITPEPPPVKVVQIPPRPAEKVAPSVDKLLAWCLLAQVKEQTNIYGEVIRSIDYVSKFSFETIILNRDGLQCDLWAPAPSITKHSIVYLWEQREWWRVNDVVQDQEGVMLNCYPSDFHPSF